MVDTPAGVETPKWFEQYVDFAKWVITLISGLLAFGVLSLKEKPDAGNILIFQWSGAAFLLSAACGLIFVMASHRYSALRQQGEPVTDRRVKGAQSYRTFTFPGMIVLFFVGMAGFLWFSVRLLQSLVVVPATPPPVIQALDGGPNGGRVAIAQRGEALWLLSQPCKGEPGWAPLPAVPSKPATP